ncbi:MAG: methyltransferase domain-containing protein [Armatimonadetes bacterium]|nr:methyltransferase domain-containing protein [Armatimonadota bacterium]
MKTPRSSTSTVIQETISTEAARRFYDRLGVRHDWVGWWEARAKARATQLLDLRPGLRVLDVGVGTGRDHALVQAGVAPGGMTVGLDLSAVMLDLTRARTGAPVCRADARAVPFAGASFDRLFCAYVLDLLPARDLPETLAGFRRVIVPGGRMVLVTLTEGVSLSSRLFIAAWKALYAVSAAACGGCRPLQLAEMVRAAGFCGVWRETVVHLAVPSEIIVATR